MTPDLAPKASLVEPSPDLSLMVQEFLHYFASAKVIST
jgi:hypothetical protein